VNLRKQILTDNDCYAAGRTIVPKGVMVHSTGANNPSLRRYVAPNDGLLGVPSLMHWNQPGTTACVHAFVGKLADGNVATYQTLPWTMRGWHCGSGAKGSANNTHIAFEICEDDLTDSAYFAVAYQEAVELTAYLCQAYHLDPLADGVVICHAEGYQRGIASNHGDVLGWFGKHNKTMDDFRADVARVMDGGEESVTYEQWKAYMDQYRKELAQQAATMPGLLAEAVTMGLTDGTRPRDLVTREEAAVMARAVASRW
jgi:hypothetical protein